MLSIPAVGRVRLVPLGGLGEIGMNCLVVEQGEDLLVVDCGIKFPHDDLGVDVVHADFSWLLEREDRIRAVFLTHGHEDHIGGLPYLLSRAEVPVWGSPHALGLVRHRLEEHDFAPEEVDLRVATPGASYAVGKLEVEPIRVAHSVVEACAFAIRTSAGTIVHTGDFNLDPDPPDGEPTDEARLSELGREGVSLLLSDSTNVDVPTKSGSEREVGRALAEIVSAATGRVFISLFASNIQRLITIGQIAARFERKVCVLGRSLVTQLDVATRVGRLKWPSDLRIAPEEARTYPRDRLLALAGGTQGEPGSAMARLAAGSHSELHIDPGDTVILSSRVIPGNDVPALGMMNDLLRRGAHVHSQVKNPSVHTSGHATRSEQARMIDLVQPRCFLPVHGTLHHLTRHGELAHERGVSEVAVIENGTAITCDGDSLRVEATVKSGVVSVGRGHIELEPDVLRDRQELGRTGLATVAVVLDRNGEVTAPPTVTTRGIARATAPAELRALTGTVLRALELTRRRRSSVEETREEVRRAVRRHLFDVGGSRPVVEVLVIET